MRFSQRLGRTLVCAALCLGMASGASAHHAHRHHKSQAPTPPPAYSWEAGGADLSPVTVIPYALPTATDPARASFLRRMNLEDGVEVRSTRGITREDVRSRDLFVLDITQSLEGGFDSVNLYDKGLLSWGIMQWSARSGSLGQALVFIKRRLWTTGRKRIWDKTFTANGIDVDAGGLIVYGQHLTTPAQMRVAFRGTIKVGRYDPKLATYWATVFARAGRQPAVAELQVEYAGRVVDAVLKRRLTGLPYHAPGRDGLTVLDLVDNDPYAEALVFALWTNNPRHAFAYIREAAVAARALSVSDNPALWQPGAFSTALRSACAQSKFGNWPQREALIEARESMDIAQLTPYERDYRSVVAARAEHRVQEMASRQGAKPRPDKNGALSVKNVTAAGRGKAL